MKALIDIPDPLIPALAALCAQEKISRTEAVRRSIEQYVANHVAAKKIENNAKNRLMSAFGAWKNQGMEDGVEYQRKLRSEWAHRDPGF